jgi:hypothetical protein
MCRSIHTLYNVDPPITAQEIQAASLQYVRKISGFRKPSKANEAAFKAAIDEITIASAQLIATLVMSSPRKERKGNSTVHQEQQLIN